MLVLLISMLTPGGGGARSFLEMRTPTAVGVGCKLVLAAGTGARCGCFQGQVVAAGFRRAAGEVPRAASMPESPTR